MFDIVDIVMLWINCHFGPTAQPDTADQSTCKPSRKVCREDNMRRVRVRRGEKGRYCSCSPMVLLGVEPVALREFHRRLYGNTPALFTARRTLARTG